MTTFLSDSYDALEDILTQMKSLKLIIYPGENVTDCSAAILVDAEHLEFHLTMWFFQFITGITFK